MLLVLRSLKEKEIYTILKLQPDSTSILNIVDVFSITSYNKPHQCLWNFNLTKEKNLMSLLIIIFISAPQLSEPFHALEPKYIEKQ